MLAKTPAIVLSSLKYGDNSIILKTYTREAGLKSFIAGGLHSKKGPVRPSMVQPLSLLNLVYYQKAKGELKRIKEASVAEPYREVLYHPVKSSLAMFLAEMLSHVLQEAEPEPKLYDFLSESFLILDQARENLGNFHLEFLYRLTQYLGFNPEKPTSSGLYFDLMNGTYSPTEPPHPHYLARSETRVWKALHMHLQQSGQKLSLNRKTRESLLMALVQYYRLHVKDFGHLRSLQILKELLS